MSPSLSSPSEPYGALTASQTAGYGDRALSTGANVSDKFGRQAGVPIELAVFRSPASLLHAVPNVVHWCTEEKVGDVTAGRIITAMEHREPIRNLTVRQDPCEPMSNEDAALNPHASVAFGIAECAPRPAIVWAASDDLLPESLCARLRNSHSVPPVQMVRGRVEFTLLPASLIVARCSP